MSVSPRSWLAPLVALAAVLAGACASTPPAVDYPPLWPATLRASQPDGCPQLSGAYDTRATQAHPSGAGSPPRLDELFAPKGPGAGVFELRAPNYQWPMLPGATTVTFDLQGDALRIRLRDDASGEAALLFRRSRPVTVDREAHGFFDCHASEVGPALRFLGRPIERGGLPWLYGEKDQFILTLFRGADGSLIVNRRVDRLVVTALLLGSQVSTRSSAWWHYAPAEPSRP